MTEPNSSASEDNGLPDDVRRSPVRPPLPDEPQPVPEPTEPSPDETFPENPLDPKAAMNTLRHKMELVADEFAQGKINRAQFHAVYKRYSEQRAIIERLIERNPSSEAWRQVIGVRGQTGFLRHHFAAQTQYFLVYRNDEIQPLLIGGKQKPLEAVILPVIKYVWSLPDRPKLGLGRKPIGETNWLILAVGDHATTAVMFANEPSAAQAQLVRDLHADFERANQAALTRGWLVADRMVFPQRSLIDSDQ